MIASVDIAAVSAAAYACLHRSVYYSASVKCDTREKAMLTCVPGSGCLSSAATSKLPDPFCKV
jgi:hypothetical protein